jgi:hypothetical protein
MAVHRIRRPGMKLLKREPALVLRVVADALRDETPIGELMDDQGEAAADGERRDRQGGGR